MKALDPLKIVLSKNGGLNAYKAKRGWYIVGPIQNAGHQISLKGNKIVVKDVSVGKLARHHFLIENAGKDIIIEQMFEQMYYNNFNEKRAQIRKINRIT